MQKGAPPSRKTSLIGLLVGLYLGYVLVARPAYNRFLRPLPAGAAAFRNAVAPGAELELDLDLQLGPASHSLLKGHALRYAVGPLAQTAVPVGAELLAARDAALSVAVRFVSACTGRREAVSCRVPLFERLPELRSTEKSPVEGVVARGAVGAEAEHLLTRVHVGLVFDASPRAFGLDAYTDALYATTNSARTLAADGGCYRPALLCDNYWTLRRDKLPAARVGPGAPPLAVAVYAAGEYRAEWATHFRLLGGAQRAVGVGPVLEDLKEMLSENSPAYLALLFAVNALHTLFFALGLSNSYAFWSRLRSSAGLSAKKYYTDLLFQLITLLYMLDNDTSPLLLLLGAAELLMNAYVAARVTGLSVRLVPRFPFLRVAAPPADAETAGHERVAVRFLLRIALPLLGAYTAYSFARRGDLRPYSFAVKTLATAVYVFGFINMTPQVYINYRLKSVESLPWRAMTYQFLNTIVDDLFAFAVRMTPLQRLAAFRDDVIFCIYLAQLWLYRKNRRAGTSLIEGAAA